MSRSRVRESSLFDCVAMLRRLLDTDRSAWSEQQRAALSQNLVDLRELSTAVLRSWQQADPWQSWDLESGGGSPPHRAESARPSLSLVVNRGSSDD